METAKATICILVHQIQVHLVLLEHNHRFEVVTNYYATTDDDGDDEEDYSTEPSRSVSRSSIETWDHYRPDKPQHDVVDANADQSINKEEDQSLSFLLLRSMPFPGLWEPPQIAFGRQVTLIIFVTFNHWLVQARGL